MNPLILSLVAFVGVSALVGGLAFLLRNPSAENLDDRLASLTGAKPGKQSKDNLLKGSILSQPLTSREDLLAAFMQRFGNLSLLFEQADTSLTASRFLMISGIMGFAGWLLPTVAGLNMAVGPAMAVTLAFLPLAWVMFRRSRRFKNFAKQLPDALELISRALRAGHSLASGFSLVAEEMMPPICKEFARVFEEQNLGIPMDEALDSMTDRIPNLDLRFFATAVVLQRQTGGDLAEILDKIGHIVRERFKIHGQVQALTGEGRLSGIVLLALPPLLFLAVYRLNPSYVSVLFTDPMGKKMLAGGIFFQLLGAVVIRKIVNIKV